MLSELERIRSRALSFSSDNGPNDKLEDLNALESVINENDLQPAFKSSPLKASPGGLLKRRRRKHCVHDTSDKLQLLALNDNNVFETGSQDGDADGNKRTVEDFPLQQADLSGQVLKKGAKTRIASTRPRKYEFNEVDRKAVMSNVSRLIRERPITLPTANVKRFDDIDQYLAVYRQRKRERENRRKQILLSKTSPPGEDPDHADPYKDSGVEESRIDIVPIDARNKRNILLERLEQQIIRERNNKKSLWDIAGRNRQLLKEKLKEQIEKHQQERMAKRAAKEREAAAMSSQNVDKSADVKFYELPELSSFDVSDTKTEDAREAAFKAIEALGAHAMEPSPSGSFAERWTVESLPANPVDPAARGKLIYSNGNKDTLTESDEITLPKNLSIGSDVVSVRSSIPRGKEDGAEKPLLSSLNKQESPEQKEANGMCWDIQPENKLELVKEWLHDLAPSEVLVRDTDSSTSEDEKDNAARCISSDDESLKILDARSENERKISETPTVYLDGEEKSPDLEKIIREYLDDQAELSGSNASEDENENSVDTNVDIIDEGQDDVEEEDGDAERNKAHIMREIADDERRLDELKGRFLPDVQPTREKRFRWNHEAIPSEPPPSIGEPPDSSEDETTITASQPPLSLTDTVENSDMADIHNENSVEKIMNSKSFRLKDSSNGNSQHPQKGFFKQVVAGFVAARKNRNCKIEDFFKEKQEEDDPEVDDDDNNTTSIFHHL